MKMKKPLKIKTIAPVYRDTLPPEGFRNCWSEATHAAWEEENGELYIGLIYCMTEENGQKTAWIIYPDEDGYLPDMTDMLKLERWKLKEEIPMCLYRWAVYGDIDQNDKAELIDRGLLTEETEEDENIPF